jgi:hypothetical protein
MRAVLLVGLFALAACVPTGSEPLAVMPTLTPTAELVCIRVALEVQVDDDAGALAATEAAFLGEIIDISPTHFNQDSGEYYEDALAIHTVTYRVIEPIVDEIGLGPEVTLTSTAGSPVDGGEVEVAEGNVRCYGVTVAHEFEVGQEMVVLAGRRELPWHLAGQREVLAFATWPPYSYFSSEEGLYQRAFTELPPMTLDELSDYIRRWRAENGG